MESGQMPPAGWYRDPEGGLGERYWDGTRWTEERRSAAPAPAATPGAPAPQEGQAAGVEHRFSSLRLIAGIFTVLAWLTIILGGLGVIIGTIVAASSDDGGEAASILLIGALSVFIYALWFFAAAAFIRLALAVEENTRRTAELLDRRA